MILGVVFGVWGVLFGFVVWDWVGCLSPLLWSLLLYVVCGFCCEFGCLVLVVLV